MSSPVIINHTLALVLEIGLLVALGLWGFSVAEGPWLNWLAAAFSVTVAIVLWGIFAAPSSATRLQMPLLFGFKFGMFGAGTLAWFGISQPLWAVVFGGLAIVHLTMAAALSIL